MGSRSSDGAARSALRHLVAAALLTACGDGIPVAPPEPAHELASAHGAAAPDPAGALDPATGEAAPVDPDAPTATADTPMKAWALTLDAELIGAVDDARFVGDALVVAGRSRDRVVVLRYASPDAAPTRFLAERAGASPVVLASTGDATAALWVADGRLEGISIAGALDSATVVDVSGSEGGRLAPPLAVAGAQERIVACSADGATVACFTLDAALGPTGVHALSRKKHGAGVPRALVAHEGGFMLVLGTCTNDACTRVDLGAVLLDADGAPGKRRELPVIQLDRGTAFVPDGDGLVLVARRVGAGEHAAWRIGAGATRELEGRFSRVVGGFDDGARTHLVERAHLVMRKGFPVRGFQLRALDVDASSRARPEREALPANVQEALPDDPDLRVSVNGDALLFAAPPRRGHLAVTAVRVGGGDPP